MNYFSHLALVSGAAALSTSIHAQTIPAGLEVDFEAGMACDFRLGIDIEGGPQVFRQFTDKNGNIRVLSAGQGSQLTFYNLSSGAKLTTRPNGSVSHITINRDGSQTIVGTGHNVIALFPTDTPPGPDTTMYVGRIEFKFTPDCPTCATGLTDILRFNGRSTDLCAALS
jgi:hypothetical protein